MMTFFTILPSLVVMMTSFTRIIIILALTRNAMNHYVNQKKRKVNEETGRKASFQLISHKGRSHDSQRVIFHILLHLASRQPDKQIQQ